MMARVFQGSAPGKIILFGEHAVVYGQPALAVPVNHVQARATIRAPSPVFPSPSRPSPQHSFTVLGRRGTRRRGGRADSGIFIEALGRRYALAEAAPDDVLAHALRLALGDDPALHTFTLSIASTIPLASGLGSGAAVCTAIVRAVAAYRGLSLTAAQVSQMVFETEQMLHGAPSGIDNTVIAYGQPVWFIKGHAPEAFAVARPFDLLIADTGVPSPTKIVVGDVRAAWQRAPEQYEPLFVEIGGIARAARALIATPGAALAALGAAMDRNHALLCALGVSSPALDTLTTVARQAGALGAKLSGGGRGGNLIALVTATTAEQVRAALRATGAKRVLQTRVE